MMTVVKMERGLGLDDDKWEKTRRNIDELIELIKQKLKEI